MQKTIFRAMALLCVFSALMVSLLGAGEFFGAKKHVAAVTEGLTVVIDAGHGGFDGGAVGVGGTVEAGLNLAVAKQLEQALQAHGVQTIMTRTDAEALADTKDADMKKRKSILNDARADAVVSIHMNIFHDASVRGTMAYYMQGSEEGQAFAKCVIDAVAAATGQKPREPNPGDYFIVRECRVPAVLVECGFLSNAEEEQQLLQADYQALLADAVADGVLAYFDGTQ